MSQIESVSLMVFLMGTCVGALAVVSGMLIAKICSRKTENF